MPKLITYFLSSRDLYHLHRVRNEKGQTVIRHPDGGMSTSFEAFEPLAHLYRDCLDEQGTTVAEMEQGWRPVAQLCEVCRRRGMADLIPVVLCHDNATGSGALVCMDIEEAAGFPMMALDPEETPEELSDHIQELWYEPALMTRLELYEAGEWEG